MLNRIKPQVGEVGVVWLVVCRCRCRVPVVVCRCGCGCGVVASLSLFFSVSVCLSPCVVVCCCCCCCGVLCVVSCVWCVLCVVCVVCAVFTSFRVLTHVSLKPLSRSLAVAGACVRVCVCGKTLKKPKEQPEQCAVFVFVGMSHVPFSSSLESHRKLSNVLMCCCVSCMLCAENVLCCAIFAENMRKKTKMDNITG